MSIGIKKLYSIHTGRSNALEKHRCVAIIKKAAVIKLPPFEKTKQKTKQNRCY